TDLIKTNPDGGEYSGGNEGEAIGSGGLNADLCVPIGGACTKEPWLASIVKYYKGPDYATGYGLVNAEKALDYTDSEYFIQDSIEHGDSTVFTFRVPQNNWNKLRVTLAWDDV